MGAIDIHTHAFPDKLAKRAVPALEQAADWHAFLDGRVKSLIKSMDRADIDISVVCPIATKPEHVGGIFDWCQEIRSGRIEPFPSVHPAMDDYALWLRRFSQEGYVGVKLHPMYQEFDADEPRMLELYAACAELNLVVLIHCGRDVAYPPEGDRAAPRRMAAALKAVPALRLVATHLGGWRMWEHSAQHLVGGQCLMETSFTLDELSPQQAIGIIRAHGADKVMFGTDSPWADQKAELERVRSLGLTPQELDQITYRNAAKLLRL